MLAPVLENEAERLQQLRDLIVLDSEPEELFDSLTRLASQVCGVPIALVSLIDSERQWFKSNVGMPGVNETPRDVAFCNHVIASDTPLMEVPDASADPRFRDNPLVTGDETHIRFYAGAPLVLPSGHRIGTLCVIDREEHKLDETQAEMLKTLARIASEALVMRRDLIHRALAARSQYENALRDAASFLRRTGQVAGVGGWQLELADSALIWSPQTRKIHEVDAEFVPSLETALGFYAPEDRPALESAVQGAIAGGSAWDMELRFTTAKGRHLWVRTQGEAEFENGLPVRLVGAIQDITERKALEQQIIVNDRFLQMQAATLNAVAEATPATVAVLGTDMRYRFVNSTYARWTGLPRERIVGALVNEILSAAEMERSQPWIDRAMAGEAVHFERESLGHSHGWGHHMTMSYAPLKAEDGSIDGFISIGQDITLHRQEQTRLRHLSESDPLTGLLNRAGFENRIALEVDEGRGAQMALLYADLDHFKPVNDNFGHPVGDQVLQQFAQRLQSAIRPSDAIARLGGDEFAVLLFGVREAGHAQAVAAKVIAAAGAPFIIDGRDILIGASVGVALGASSGWQELVARADGQLYRAKEAGRGRQAG